MIYTHKAIEIISDKILKAIKIVDEVDEMRDEAYFLSAPTVAQLKELNKMELKAIQAWKDVTLNATIVAESIVAERKEHNDTCTLTNHLEDTILL